MAGDSPAANAGLAKDNKTNQRRCAPAKTSAQLNALLSGPELTAVLAGRAHAVHYISRPLGSMMIKLAGQFYEFVCTRSGRQYYRCVEQQRCGCEARILKMGQSVYEIGSGRHSHEAPLAGLVSGMSEHVLDRVAAASD